MHHIYTTHVYNIPSEYTDHPRPKGWLGSNWQLLAVIEPFPAVFAILKKYFN